MLMGMAMLIPILIPVPVAMLIPVPVPVPVPIPMAMAVAGVESGEERVGPGERHLAAGGRPGGVAECRVKPCQVVLWCGVTSIRAKLVTFHQVSSWNSGKNSGNSLGLL